MDIAYLSALSALAGSVVGGLITGVATWASQRFQVMAGKRAHDQTRLDDLQRDFILAASKAYGSALTSNDPQIQEIVDLYALVNRMRILAPPRIVACADEIMRVTLDTYFTPNKTLSEIHDILKTGVTPWLDPLRQFSEIAREERQRLWND